MGDGLGRAKGGLNRAGGLREALRTWAKAEKAAPQRRGGLWAGNFQTIDRYVCYVAES